MNPALASSRKRRQDKRSTMRELLNAGKDLVSQEKPSNIRHLRIQDIASHAGVPVGKIYYYWRGGADAYMEHLLYEIFQTDYKDTAEQLLEHALDQAQDVSLSQVLRELFEEDFENLTTDPVSVASFRLQMSLWADVEGDQATDDVLDEHAKTLLDRMYCERDRRWREHFSDLLHGFDREPREPFSYEMIIALLTALVEGLAIRYAVDRSPFEDVEDPSGNIWQLLSLGALALITATTRRSEQSVHSMSHDFWSFVDDHLEPPSDMTATRGRFQHAEGETKGRRNRAGPSRLERKSSDSRGDEE